MTSSTTRTHVPRHRVDLLDALLTAVRFYFDIALYTVVLTALDGWHVLRALVLAPTSAGGDSLNSVNVALHSTPTFFTAFWDHMKYRGSRSQKKRAKQELAYGEGLALVREFLQFAGTFTIEALQSFTGKDTPTPSWIERSVVEVPRHCLEVAAELLREHLKRDDPGFKDVGGKQWWTLRARPLFGEWIEMLRDAQKREAMHRAGQAEQTPERIMLVLHGGAHFFAGNGTHRYQVQRHARKLGARAFSPSFRLAPQYPFPCSLQDALAAYLYLIDPPDSAKIDGTDDPPKAIHAHNIVLYGDSSGGALALSLLVVLRDAGLPMPAGCVLMSPWVDLTHSFPSVMGDASGDYISPDGFHYRPSVSWPPIRGDPMVVRKKGKELVVKEQVQLYCSNSMITNPIVSLVNQGSLGGLCPLLVMGGSVELLADEIVYIAHKAADPERYPPAEATLARYPQQRSLISAYPPTKVHLQMYDDCCHVTTTLSFSSPAKFQYRSAANFSLWALAAAQARVEREGQQELVEAQKDQHHFDFATNMEAEHPPQHSSPPRYRRPVVASPPVMSPLPGNEDMFANSPLRNDISSQDSLQPAIPDDAPHSPSGHADAGSFMSNGPGTDAGGEKARDGNDSGYLTRVGTSEGRAADTSVSGTAAESTRASDVYEQRQTRARTKSVIGSLRSGRSEDSYVTDEDALAANQENEQHSEFTEDSESDEEREQQEGAADGSVGVSSRLRGAFETAVDAAPSDGLRNAGNANTRARTDTGGSTASQHVEKQLVNESDLFYPRARFVSVTGVEPAFEDSMIRERVTTDGYIRAMEARSALQALSFPRDEVGVISPEGPILAWLSKRKQWDAKYRRELLHFRKLKMRDRARAAKAGYLSRELRVDEGENPPLSAVAGMYDEELAWEAVRGQDSSSADDDSGQKETAGLGIRLWSSLSSRPDAAQAGKQTLARMARDGDMKLERKVSDGAPIPTPEVEKTILM